MIRRMKRKPLVALVTGLAAAALAIGGVSVVSAADASEHSSIQAGVIPPDW
ncbi:hypothetical protein SAMN05216215_11166 [Saccharopolyspora shandongensis]|uniref:Uncharacterized protein n=1 Tax=Saccharopolyspora shandongensis TaxID=418495 RepID=A0A1H3U7V2_9PSEU|nr:hypothetical protein SAMN05216215_11166 [Saccharopolyspora shandongensis]